MKKKYLKSIDIGPDKGDKYRFIIAEGPCKFLGSPNEPCAFVTVCGLGRQWAHTYEIDYKYLDSILSTVSSLPGDEIKHFDKYLCRLAEDGNPYRRRTVIGPVPDKRIYSSPNLSD